MFFKSQQPSPEQIQQLTQLFAQGRLEELIEDANELADKFPKAAQPHNILSVAYNAVGDYHSAVSSADQAIIIEPDLAKAYVNRGNALDNLGRYDEALASYSKAVELEPDFAEAHNNLGAFLLKLERHEEAIESFERAIELKPDHFRALNNLGCALLDLGHKEEAEAYIGQAIELKPDYAEAHRNLSTIKRYKDGDPQIALMEELLDSDDLTEQQRMHLDFALSKAEDDIGDIDNAFRHLQEANELGKMFSGYDIDADRELFVRIKAAFSTPDLRQPLEVVENEFTPLFIVSMPRAGSTLVEQILSAHSMVHAGGESDAFRQAISNVAWAQHGAGKQQLQSLRDDYLSWLLSLDIEEHYVTDKAPLNFRWIGFILQALPEAKIVHVKRDARATCWSNYKHYFEASGHDYGYDLEDISDYYKLYVDLMDFWEEKFPGRIHHISYEALTESQEEETRKLLEYCGLEWEEGCMDFHLSERAVATASTQQVRQKMYRGSSDVWRKYEDYLQPMLENLEGY